MTGNESLSSHGVAGSIYFVVVSTLGPNLITAFPKKGMEASSQRGATQHGNVRYDIRTRKIRKTNDYALIEGQVSIKACDTIDPSIWL